MDDKKKEVLVRILEKLPSYELEAILNEVNEKKEGSHPKVKVRREDSSCYLENRCIW